MRTSFFTLLIFTGNILLAQSPITGTWAGKLFQENGDGTYRNFDFSLSITETNGTVTGTSTILSGPSFGIMELEGTFKKNELEVKEFNITNQKKESYWSWCFKTSKLKLSTSDGKMKLTGPWTGYIMYGDRKEMCLPGTITLSKEVGYLSFKGFIIDEITKDNLAGGIKVTDQAGKVVFEKGESNQFEIQIPTAGKYEFFFTSKGYLTRSFSLEVNESMIKNIELKKIEIKKTIALKNVLFKKGTSELLPESFTEMEGLLFLLNENPGIEIELHGHTSNEGDVNKNLALSADRVNAVKNYLVEKGIRGKRIEVKAYGGSKPIVSNDTEENRQLNRRVEFMITKQ